MITCTTPERIIPAHTIKLYRYEELSAEAKAHALDEWNSNADYGLYNVSAEDESTNYSSKWAIHKIERWEAKHERHEESLQSRWGAYGLRMSWAGPYWPIIDSPENGSVIGRQVIDLVPYK